MAARKLGREKSGHTLQATALVHEAFIRLVGTTGTCVQPWNSRGHFFAAAAEAMRRILVEAARRRNSAKRGGGAARCELFDVHANSFTDDQELLAIHDLLDLLEDHDVLAAKLVKLRFFAGLSTADTAAALGISVRSAYDVWCYARAWLRREMGT